MANMRTIQGHLYAYIDETGDRGMSPQSSPIFGMAAVLVSQTHAPHLRQAVSLLRKDFHVPDDRPMSWKEAGKTHDRRRHAAEVLGAVDNVRVLYVYADKQQLQHAGFANDLTLFYNYVAGKMFKSILWAAQNWQGHPTPVHIRYGHVRRHDHRTTEAYLRGSTFEDDPKIPTYLLAGLEWVSATQYLESQAADMYGGFLRAAVWPKRTEWGDEYTYPEFLHAVWHQIRHSEDCAIPLGIFVMPHHSAFTDSGALPCTSCPKKRPDRDLRGPIH